MLQSHDNQVIIASCTPSGSGAIAILRLCGTGVFELVSRMSKLASKKCITKVPTHTISYGFVVDSSGVVIDQVLFMIMHGPKTFTGQDTVEINCHNNPFIIESIISVAITFGARLAQNGEFTRRAVLNDKIDLVQAEAINELIHANTQLSLKQSLAQLQGSFSHWITVLEKNLVKALAFCEASFEFIDEEMAFDEQIKQVISESLASIESIKKTFDQQQHIRQGVRIAIIGSVNAGKSSLFNALIGTQRAIVTDIAGTTRDVIEAGLYKNGNYWTLIDTAGLRQTQDCIEQEGIKRSYEQAQLADVILLVVDGSRDLTLSEKKVYDDLYAQHASKIIPIYNKIDLISGVIDCDYASVNRENIKCSNQSHGQFAAADSQPGSHTIFGQVTHKLGNYKSSVSISTKNSSGIDQVELSIQAHIDALFKSVDSPFLLNQRQFNLILGLEKMLLDIMNQMSGDVQHELVSYHLNDALSHISELTGKSISEQGMDAVFREFCVGK